MKTLFDKNTFVPKKIINRLKLLYSFLAKKEKTAGLPLEIGIEVTNKCNLKCIMCAHKDMVVKKIRPQGNMGFSLYKKIIDEVYSSVELVYLHGLGEPLLHPQLFKFIKYAKGKGVRVGISTNATLLNKKRSKKLLDSGIDYIIFGIDGACKKTYEQIRVGGKFKRVEKNISNFLQAKKKRKKTSFTVVQFISMDKNKQEEEVFLKRWQNKGAEVVRIKQKIAFRNIDKKNSKIKKFPYCFHIFRQLNILFDGTVVPCCEDFNGLYPLGNVNNLTLKQIWNNQKMRFLRKSNFLGKKDKIPLCKACCYPQPTIWQAIGVLLLDHLTVKKLLPPIEKYARKNPGIFKF